MPLSPELKEGGPPIIFPRGQCDHWVQLMQETGAQRAAGPEAPANGD